MLRDHSAVMASPSDTRSSSSVGLLDLPRTSRSTSPEADTVVSLITPSGVAAFVGFCRAGGVGYASVKMPTAPDSSRDNALTQIDQPTRYLDDKR